MLDSTCCELALVSVEESIAEFQMFHLLADDAGGDGTDQSAWKMIFVVWTNEKIDVFHVSRTVTMRFAFEFVFGRTTDW